jgi:hypothetical protein
VITNSIPDLSRTGSTTPWILPRPARRARLLNAARLVVATVNVLLHTTPITLGLALGLLVANLIGAGR